ncbi:hypothetical protein H2203_006689 [Taxawa tesnikishii (nom. ined.)]|nr:hypothetical protein H2203_006689 [Dothideales sp. JES 119]
MSFLRTAALVGSLVATAAAHGTVQGLPILPVPEPSPTVIGWSVPDDLSNGFVSDYTSPDIICHLNATPAGTHAPVKAGGKVAFEWTVWPDSHHGPVITYLAKCPAKCEDADKTTLKWFKIDEGGLVSDTTVPGTWASDQLIANNNSWTSTIPSDIAPGNYVARHEIIALHSAGTAGGAQNYPQCINLKVTGSGTAEPEGVLGTKLYTENDPGILINIYQSLSTYQIPGPTLYSGAATAAQTGVASATGVATSAAASSAAAVTSSSTASSSAAVSSSAAAVTSAPIASSAVVTKVVTTSNVAYATDVATVTAAASAAVSSVVAPIESLTAALPSSVLTATVTGAAAVAATASPSSTDSTSYTPEKPLPAGATLKDVIEWLRYLLSEMFASDASTSTAAASASPSSYSKRAHARDIMRN